MSITLPIIQAAYTTGATLYAIVRNSLTGQVWNGSAFEAYNGAHWSTYAIALTEQGSSGFYSVARPAGLAGYLTTECIYQQGGGSPATSDAPPFTIASTGGINVAAISGDAASAPTNLQASLSSEIQGVVSSGTITAKIFPTNLSNTNVGAYQGRIILFISGVASGMAGLIANYTPTLGVITLSGSLAIAPVATDTFIIV